MRLLALLGTGSSHGGSIVMTPEQFTKVEGKPVAVEGALHSCPIDGHGITNVTPIVFRQKINGKYVLTEGAMAGCGAILTRNGSATRTYAE